MTADNKQPGANGLQPESSGSVNTDNHVPLATGTDLITGEKFVIDTAEDIQALRKSMALQDDED